jgi:glutathione S-transferase
VPFERLERRRETGQRPLPTAPSIRRGRAYAPFLQRDVFLDGCNKLGHIETFPRLKAWGTALLKRPSTHSFPPAEFEAMYRENLKRRKKWVSQFIAASQVAAE